MLKYIENCPSNNFRKKSLLKEFSFHYEYFGNYIGMFKKLSLLYCGRFFTQFIMS